MASVRRKDSDFLSEESQPSPAEKAHEQTHNVAMSVVGSSSAPLPTTMCMSSSSSGSVDTMTCLKSVNSPQTPQKKRKKRKKKKTTQSSSSSASMETKEVGVRKSLFLAGIQSEKLSRDFALPPEVDEALLREIIESCQLGGFDNLTDLIGVQIFSCKAQLLEVALKTFCRDLYSVFEAICTKVIDSISTDFFSFYSSYLMEDPTSCQEEAAFGRKFNRDMEDATEKLYDFLRKIEELVVESEENKCESLRKNIRKRETFIRKKDEFEAKFLKIGEGVRKIKKLFSLWKALCDNQFALSLLQKNTLQELFGDEVGKMRSVGEGYKQLAALNQFHNRIIINGRMVCRQESFIQFENFASSFPQELSEVKAVSFSRCLREYEKLFTELLRQNLSSSFQEKSAVGGGSSSSASDSSEEEEVKKLSKVCLPLTACYFASKTRFIVDNCLLPLISKSPFIKQESFNKMISIFAHFVNGEEKQESFEASDFPILSALPNFKQQVAQLRGDWAQISKDILPKFHSSAETFGYTHRDSETPMDWVGIFAQLAPSFKTWYKQLFSKLSNLTLRHVGWGSQLITRVSPESRMVAAEEYTNLHIAIFAPLYALVEFGVNFHILEDLVEEKDLEQDSYQHPLEFVTYFLELPELGEKFSDCEEASVSDSSSVEKRDESVDLQEESDEEVREAKWEKMEVLVSSKASEEKNTVAQPQKKSKLVSKTAKKKKAKKKEPFIKRGEKNRKVLRMIHKALRMAPHHVNGSHLVFPDGISLPLHGGGGSLPLGLARSLGKQFQAHQRREN